MANNKEQEIKNQDLLQKQKDSVASVIRKMKCNVITLGADLVSVREQIGKDIIDRDTKEVKTDENGFTLKWPSKYYANFAFMGGEVETEVQFENYQMLLDNIGMPYFLTGRLTKIKSFGSDVIAPVFSQFELLA